MSVTTSIAYDIDRVISHADAYFQAHFGETPMCEWGFPYRFKRLEFLAAQKLMDSDSLLTLQDCRGRLVTLIELFEWFRGDMDEEKMPLTVADVDSAITALRDLLRDEDPEGEVSP